MPWFEFLQPIIHWRVYDNSNTGDLHPQEPESWRVRMREPDELGWPSNPVDVPILEETFYFDCDIEHVERFCNEELWKDFAWGYSQEDYDQCVFDNTDGCAQILTEDLPYQNGWLQMQACNADQTLCSVWSNAKVVPEPSLSLVFGVSILFLTFLCKIKNKKAPRAETRGAS